MESAVAEFDRLVAAVAILWTEGDRWRCTLGWTGRRFALRLFDAGVKIREDKFVDELQAFAMARAWRRECAQPIR